MVQLRRTRASAEAFDLECELITPEEAGERYPLIRTDDLAGAIWLPGDGKANPTDLTQALAKGARQQGARIVEQLPGHGDPRRARASDWRATLTPASSRRTSS